MPDDSDWEGRTDITAGVPDAEVLQGAEVGQVVGFSNVGKVAVVEVRFVGKRGTAKFLPDQLVKMEVPEEPPTQVQTLAWLLTQEPDHVGFLMQETPESSSPNSIQSLAYMLADSTPQVPDAVVLQGAEAREVPKPTKKKAATHIKLVGKGWCRPSGCNAGEATCRTNGFWKDKSSHTECATMCVATPDCVGFAISSSNYAPGVPDTCMVHASGSVPSGWRASKQKYHDISSASGASEVQCYRTSGK